MEVHAHAHTVSTATGRKKWTHYLWEFLMLFLAVFCGFLAENFRESQVENHREKEYMRSLVQDLSVDVRNIDENLEFGAVIAEKLDSLVYVLNEKDPDKKVPLGGYQMLVRGEIFRGRFRKSFEKPEAFQPGKRETVKFTLPDAAHTFKKGHRLMIQIQSSWFPLSDRNPQKFVNIYTCGDSDFQKATIRIFHDRMDASSVILPVISGKP